MAKFQLLAVFVIVLTIKHAAGQGKYADEYAMAAKRTLVVELLEEDPELIKKMNKGRDGDSAISQYRQYLSSYNAAISRIINKYWTVNEKKEYRATSELIALWKTKSDQYMFFRLHEYNPNSGYSQKTQNSMDSRGNPVQTQPYQYMNDPTTILPIFEYQRSDKPGRPLCGVIGPWVFTMKDDTNVYAGLLFAVQFLQERIRYNQKNQEHLSSAKFAEYQAAQYCEVLTTKQLLIDREFFSKEDAPEIIKENYPHKWQLLSAAEIDSSIKSGEENALILVAVPTDVVAQPSPAYNMGTIPSHARFFRAIVDPVQGRVVSINLPGMTEHNNKFKAQDLKKFGKCK